MINIVARLQNALHEESAAHSSILLPTIVQIAPGTTAAIEAMRDAITEIERLQVALGHVVDLRADNERLRAALQRIADMCPATCELTLAHEMADNAMAALKGTKP